jgi:chromosome partitioning protein
MRHRRDVLAVVNLKGGTTKTTSAVFFAHAWYEMGKRVELIDADPQASAQSWQDDAPEPFPFPVVGMASTRLHAQLQDVVPPDRDAVVIDTPPLEEKAGIVMSALRVASVVVIPMKPGSMEYKRVLRVREVVQDAAGVREDGEAAPFFVLFTRTKPNASSTDIYREQLTADGFHVLAATVGEREYFSQSESENVHSAMNTAYGDALEEIAKELAR